MTQLKTSHTSTRLVTTRVLQRFPENFEVSSVAWRLPLRRRVHLALAIPLALAAIALAARLFGLGDKPLWYDEILTLKRASLPFWELIADAFHNKHYPTYFLAVSPFVGADWSAWMVRLPSAVLGAVCVYLVASIAYRVSGRVSAACVAGVLMALSPLEVQFGQEARSYTLTSAAILLSLWGFIGIISADRAARSLGDGNQPAVLPWVAYVLGMSLALNTLSVSAPWFVAVNLVAAWLWWVGLTPRNWSICPWAAANSAVMLSWLPGLLALASSNYEAPLQGLDWTPDLTWELVHNVFAAAFGLRVSDLMTLNLMPAIVPGLGILVAALALLGVWSLRTRLGILITLSTAIATMPLILLLVSLAHPMFISRYLLWSTGPYFVLVGIGVAALPRKMQPLLAGCLAVSAALSLAAYYASETKPRWDLAATYLAEHGSPSDVMITDTGLARIVLAAYLDRAGAAAVKATEFHDMPIVKDRFNNGRTLWVIHGRTGQGTVEQVEEFLNRWTSFGTPNTEVVFGKHIVIRRYGPDANP